MNENNLSEGFISKLTDISFKKNPELVEIRVHKKLNTAGTDYEIIASFKNIIKDILVLMARNENISKFEYMCVTGV